MAALPSQPVHASEVDGRAWSHIDFISDVHLQRSEDATFQAWRHYMQSVQADALFILGDLFEVWVGDDLLNHPEGAFERDCLQIIQSTSQRLPIFGLVGNRDFLMRSHAWHMSGMQALSDPAVLHVEQQCILLSHGDELCVDDLDYQAFRRQVRADDWQQVFFKQSLPERLSMARGLRQQSEARKAQQTTWVDVDNAMAQAWLSQHACQVLVHGHTHQAARHFLPAGERWVLSDWDATAQPPRLQTLQWRANTGFTVAQLMG
jgi:UDP-2,3-diacylglucosamine hydrolase